MAQRHIGMISGPRNISTTMMRSFENRDDMVVVDEPFYACYLRDSGACHPMREAVMQSQPTQWQEAINGLDGFAQENSGRFIFEKHIAFHFTQAMPRDWLSTRALFLLIRDPRQMIASYRNKYADVAPILDSLIFQRTLYDEYALKDEKLTIVDASDILKRPKQLLSKLCKQLDIPFKNTMLEWPKGKRESDGVWAGHWYDQVIASTGFRPYAKKEILLPPVLEKLSDQCMDDYEYLYVKRMT